MLRLLFVLLAVTATGAWAQSECPALKRIKESGTITLGYRAGAAPFSLSSLFLLFLKIGSVLFGSGYVLGGYESVENRLPHRMRRSGVSRYVGRDPYRGAGEGCAASYRACGGTVESRAPSRSEFCVDDTAAAGTIESAASTREAGDFPMNKIGWIGERRVADSFCHGMTERTGA